ncbi:hypothetical protein K8O68_11015 [Salipaludibacillus sp. CUR1]|uniref:WD40/YVTN/BNR-like repeat-containing protein n=1 Tax=Salipaludibacillus sp. CUR1 TaxID=2820003 RepID=UPI001E4802A8|nr:hypothetical protein [Salipaludibacillus sp. CUR1]MCE7792946.1 hypothetical protein [Salipaludibacillus sp. CUR1]
MTGSHIFPGATAVTKSIRGDYFFAKDGAISFIDKKGSEKCLTTINQRLLDLISIENILLGVGDHGTFVRSHDYGQTWKTSTLPTLSSIWSLSADRNGTVVTHGNHVIFISYDFGETWRTIRPFHSLNDQKPSIRSLLLDGKTIYAGTKIHSHSGGLWKIDLERLETIRIKKETRMIASILKYDNYLVTATGTCSGSKGSIDFCQTEGSYGKNYLWETCETEKQERCYLHLCENNGYIFASSSQDADGIGKVYRIYLEEKMLVTCARVHGHGWRISNLQSDFFVAGLYGSLLSNSEQNQLILQ